MVMAVLLLPAGDMEGDTLCMALRCQNCRESLLLLLLLSVATAVAAAAAAAAADTIADSTHNQEVTIVPLLCRLKSERLTVRRCKVEFLAGFTLEQPHACADLLLA